MPLDRYTIPEFIWSIALGLVGLYIFVPYVCLSLVHRPECDEIVDIWITIVTREG